METIDLMRFDKRRIGVELENPIVHPDGTLIEYPVIEKIWLKLEKAGWKLKRSPESGDIHAAQKEVENRTVVLSSDGAWSTFEIALPPLDSIDQAKQYFEIVKQEVLAALAGEELYWIALGLAPGSIDIDNRFMTSKPLYLSLQKFWYLFNLCLPTAANQAGISIKLHEAVPAINGLSAVSGLITALTANSSISDFKPQHWLETRHLFFSRFFHTTAYEGFEKMIHVPPDHPVTSLADYLRYFLDCKPFMLVCPVRDGTFIVPDERMTWLAYFKGKKWSGTDLNGNPRELIPEPADLNVAMENQWMFTQAHMLFDTEQVEIPAFVDALEHDELENYVQNKLKNLYIEYRPASAQPVGHEFTVAALTLGLVENLPALGGFTRTYQWNEWTALNAHASVAGMRALIGGKPCRELLKPLVDIAQAGLKARGLGEEQYLDPLYERIETGRTPAEDANGLVRRYAPEDFLKAVSYT